MSITRFLMTALAAGAVAWAGMPVLAANATNAADAPVEASAVRTAGGDYRVVVDGATLGTVAVSDPAYTASVVAHPNGRLAAVITDFDGTSGAALQLVSDGTARSVHTGRVTSAAWSANGGRLAYAADGVLRVTGRSTAVTLPGVNPTVLGWSSDNRSVLVQTHPGGAHDAGYTPSVVKVDLIRDTVTGVLRSDPADGVVYRDLRLVTVDRRQLISYVRAEHVYPCAGSATSVGLADLTGREVLRTATTTDSYRSAVFSADGEQVVLERQACVLQEARVQDRSGALKRVAATNGVYVVGIESGAAHRIVKGLSANFVLAGFAGEQVRLTSSRFGDRHVDATPAAPADASAMDRVVTGDEVSIQARINPNEFIHQLWDTRDEFDGNSACGPASAVMDLAGYQLPNGWGTWVSYPYRHWSKWGLYITNTFSNNGSTFNRSEPDASGNGAWTGAYGWMVLDYRIGTYWSEMTDFLQRNGAYVRTGMYDAAWIRARINEGYMVVVSGDFNYGRYSHIALITGYTDDGRFYVNDPYGYGTDGSYDGQNSVYTLDYMRPKNYWAA